MWTRIELKEKAKTVLRNIYWKAFLVSLVIALVNNNMSYRSKSHVSLHTAFDFVLSNLWIIIPFLGGTLFFIALRVFLGNPLEVGGRRYFVQSAQYQDNRRCFKFVFHAENYLGIVITMVLKNVLVFLWYLLLIIPGIVKSYAYKMVPYILADNPNIGYNEALALSKKMTHGYKFDMLVLDLSFIGWYMLGVLALGVGVLFVMPYSNATYAELYLVLRQNALDNHFCSDADLRLTQKTQSRT